MKLISCSSRLLEMAALLAGLAAGFQFYWKIKVLPAVTHSRKVTSSPRPSSFQHGGVSVTGPFFPKLHKHSGSTFQQSEPTPLHHPAIRGPWRAFVSHSIPGALGQWSRWRQCSLLLKPSSACPPPPVSHEQSLYCGGKWGPQEEQTHQAGVKNK